METDDGGGARQEQTKIRFFARDHDDLCVVPGCKRKNWPPSKYCRVHAWVGRKRGIPLKLGEEEVGR